MDGIPRDQLPRALVCLEGDQVIEVRVTRRGTSGANGGTTSS
ncbi:hypothetical protein ACFQ2B_40220 [Streptomyces stramineus]